MPIPALVVSATAVTRGGRAWLAARRGKLAVFALLVVAMGLPHYARLWWTYGSPWIGPLLVAERPSTNAFLLRHAARSHLHVWLTLVLLYPSCWIALFPTFWRQLRARIGTAEPALWPALLAAYTFAVVSLSTFNQERYWSIFELLSLGAFFVYAGQAQLRGRVLAAWLSLALLCMGGSSYLCAVAQPGVATARIKPLAVALSPAVAKWYDDVN